jgi:hypothetical protein
VFFSVPGLIDSASVGFSRQQAAATGSPLVLSFPARPDASQSEFPQPSLKFDRETRHTIADVTSTAAVSVPQEKHRTLVSDLDANSVTLSVGIESLPPKSPLDIKALSTNSVSVNIPSVDKPVAPFAQLTASTVVDNCNILPTPPGVHTPAVANSTDELSICVSSSSSSGRDSSPSIRSREEDGISPVPYHPPHGRPLSSYHVSFPLRASHPNSFRSDAPSSKHQHPLTDSSSSSSCEENQRYQQPSRSFGDSKSFSRDEIHESVRSQLRAAAVQGAQRVVTSASPLPSRLSAAYVREQAEGLIDRALEGHSLQPRTPHPYDVQPSLSETALQSALQSSRSELQHALRAISHSWKL